MKRFSRSKHLIEAAVQNSIHRRVAEKRYWNEKIREAIQQMYKTTSLINWPMIAKLAEKLGVKNGT